jgi:hypothetical protein
MKNSNPKIKTVGVDTMKLHDMGAPLYSLGFVGWVPTDMTWFNKNRSRMPAMQLASFGTTWSRDQLKGTK